MVKIVDFQDKNKLYITDSVKEYLKLQKEGKTVVPEYHYTDKNESTLSDYDIDGMSWPHSEYIVTLPEETPINDLYRIYQRLNNIPWTILETEHLIVRETTIEDVDVFYEIYSDASITENMDPLFDNIEDEKLYTRNYIKDIYRFYGYGIWTVIYKNSNTIIGRAGITMIDGYEYPELGFVTSVDYQRQGLTYEVTRAILDYAKKELGFPTIQARVKPNNTKSINLLKKLEFNIPHTPYQGYLIALRTFS